MPARGRASPLPPRAGSRAGGRRGTDPLPVTVADETEGGGCYPTGSGGCYRTGSGGSAGAVTSKSRSAVSAVRLPRLPPGTGGDRQQPAPNPAGNFPRRAGRWSGRAGGGSSPSAPGIASRRRRGPVCLLFPSFPPGGGETHRRSGVAGPGGAGSVRGGCVWGVCGGCGGVSGGCLCISRPRRRVCPLPVCPVPIPAAETTVVVSGSARAAGPAGRAPGAARCVTTGDNGGWG